MTMIPRCLPPVRETRPPSFELPPGSVDCHTHVFDSRYPMVAVRGYDPPDSTVDDMLAMHGRLGVDRVVLTQPSAYGTDNSAILDTVAKLGDRGRAVVALPSSITDDELARLHEAGARGIRLNLDNPGGMPIEMDEIPVMAARVAELGWHVEFLFPGGDLPELTELFRSLQVPVSIGHFAYQSAEAGVDGAGFRALLSLVAEGTTWIKLSAPNRLGVGDLPPWPEVVPMAHALIGTAPERMLWGSDWPHPNKFEVLPNDGDLIDQLELWAPDPVTRGRILVENPKTLYGFT